MDIRFNSDDTLLVGFSQFDYDDREKNEFVDFLMGRKDKNIVISQEWINERQTLMNWLPFMEMIFMYSTKELQLGENQIAIVFKNEVCDMVVMTVSKDFYDFLNQRP